MLTCVRAARSASAAARLLPVAASAAAQRQPSSRAAPRRQLHSQLQRAFAATPPHEPVPPTSEGSSGATPSAPASARSAPSSGSGGSGGGPAGDDPSSVTWDRLVRLEPGEQAALFNALPMFRHTCVEARPSRHNSSLPCEGRVVEQLSGLQVFISHHALYVRMLFELARYVQVSRSMEDTIIGAREGFVLMAELFNSFHLAASRKRLRDITTPQVYRAVDASWKEMDRMGLRLKYHLRVTDTVLLDLHIHDSDRFSSGGGGGGGVRIPVMPPLGVKPAGAQPPSSNFRMAGSHPADSNNSHTSSFSTKGDSTPSSSSSSSSSASKPKTPSPDRAVRYADLDVQVSVHETFELWSTKKGQKSKLEGEKKEAEAEMDASSSSSGGGKDTAAPMVEEQAATLDSNERMVDSLLSRFDALVEHSRIASTAAGSAQLAERMRALQLQLKGVEEQAVAFKHLRGEEAPIAAMAGAEEGAATGAGAGVAAPSTATSAADSAAAAAPSSSVDPDTVDHLPPLHLLSSISGDAERGLRFGTPLPAMAVPPPVVPINQWVAGEHPDQRTAGLAQYAVNAAVESWTNVPAVKNAQKPNWTIKDVLD